MINQVNFNTKIITIDGPAASGKSAAGAFLSEKINFSYLDTGLMYRAVTAYFIENNILPEQLNEISEHLENMNLNMKFIKRKISNIFINNNDYMSKLFLSKIDLSVSKYSSISSIRRYLVTKQRLIAKNKNIIMIGRDIGTVVIPSAKFKFYLKASSLIRAKRRYEQTKNKDKSIQEIKTSIELRDKIDSTRKDSPLMPANDAIIIYTDDLNLSEVVDKMYYAFIGENL